MVEGARGDVADFSSRGPARLCCSASPALIAVSLTACVETITKHGHQFDEAIYLDFAGMSQEQVKMRSACSIIYCGGSAG